MTETRTTVTDGVVAARGGETIETSAASFIRALRIGEGIKEDILVARALSSKAEEGSGTRETVNIVVARLADFHVARVDDHRLRRTSAISVVPRFKLDSQCRYQQGNENSKNQCRLHGGVGGSDERPHRKPRRKRQVGKIYL